MKKTISRVLDALEDNDAVLQAISLMVVLSSIVAAFAFMLFVAQEIKRFF